MVMADRFVTREAALAGEGTKVGAANNDVRQKHGWERAVNLITPLPRRQWLRRTVTLWALRRPWLLNALGRLGLTRIRPVEDQLRRLNHLHYARWSIVHRLPRPPGAERESCRLTLLLFTSHFDFGWRNYLGSFIETTGDGLSNLWGDAPSWRSPSAGFREFENFVVDQQVEHGHVFDAFPNLACNDIKSALRVRREVDANERSEQTLRSFGGHSSAAKIKARNRALLKSLQHCLGTIEEWTYKAEHEGIDLGAAEPVKRDPEASGITALLPFRHDEVAEMQGRLDELYIGAQSPFAAVPGTHFARLAIIDRAHFERRSVRPLANAYLLLSAEIDQTVDDWLCRLERPSALHPVWALCHGYNGPHSLPWLVLQCRIRPSLEFIDYPATTVNEIAVAVSGANGEVAKLVRAAGK